jgi:hypothetical protein
VNQAFETLRQRQDVQLGGVGFGHRLRHAGEKGADLAGGHILFDLRQQALGQVIVTGRELIEAVVGEAEDKTRAPDSVADFFGLDQAFGREL